MCAAFDEGVKSCGLISAAIGDSTVLDRLLVRLLVSLLQSICRRFLSERDSSRRSEPVRRDVPVGCQDPAVSTLLYKSAAVESREKAVILPSAHGRSSGLSALHEIFTSLAGRYAGRPWDEGAWGCSDTLAETEHVDSDCTRRLSEQDVTRKIR